MEIAKEVNPTIQVLRAHFSALTQKDIEHAAQNLSMPNKHLADAVTVRQQLDLRMGAAFTRFQTLAFRKILGIDAGKPVSYGPCQFPTVGFIVKKFKQTVHHETERYWSIVINMKILQDAELDLGNPDEAETEMLGLPVLDEQINDEADPVDGDTEA